MRLLACLLLSLVQDKKPEPPKPPPPVDEIKVAEAIRKGVAHLLKAPSKEAPYPDDWRKPDELILLTFIHAGVPENDPKVQGLLKGMLAAPLEKTYKVALQAMCLEEIDRVKHQERIAQCAQFLVDNQCANGQWGYGSPSEFVKKVEVPEPKDVATGPKPGAVEFKGPGEKTKPKVLQRVAVKKQKEGPASGDNSNTQYAALGLRACYDSGVRVEEAVVVLAVKWWRESQLPAEEKEGVYAGKGWNYKDRTAQPDKAAYHAMTAGGTASLVIYDYLLGREWKSSSFVKAGMKWLDDHFAVNTNYYYMYGLERVGVLYGTELIGADDWYRKGAPVILKGQRPDGSWGATRKAGEEFRDTWDTCFAILFLKKATRPLVASQDGRK